jgi:hypothetical protein
VVRVSCAGTTVSVQGSLTARVNPTRVTLDFVPPPGDQVSGVVVYRTDLPVGRETRLTSAPIAPDGAGRFEFIDSGVKPARSYRYVVGFISAGAEWRSAPIEARTPPATFSLGRPVPNPTARGFRITLSMPEDGRARVRIYDVDGHVTWPLVDGAIEAGDHEVTWNGTDSDGRSVRNGVYFVVFEAAGRRATRKLVVLR